VSEHEQLVLLRWIPLLPLLGAVIHGLLLGLLRRPLSRGLVIALSCGAVGTSLLLSCWAFAELLSMESRSAMLLDTVYTWLGAGIGDATFSADLAFQFDALSAVMCFVVTGVGFLIHVYSVGYMDEDHRDDGGFQRFFCYLNLFVSAMLVLVLGDNLLLMFLGWEGVGLCSYLLISFWYGEDYNAYAGTKAFVVNRVGDFGFLVGIFLLFWTLAELGAPAVAFRDVQAGLAAHAEAIADLAVALPAWLGGGEMSLLTLIGLCFFLGAVGKSAQLPLYVWLPDAMAGPTPVSALIHAATMVTAGVYMVCRMSFLYAEAPGASEVIAWVGGLTALFAATIAINQNDIKKVLAYSTVSQLGYMFLAAGCGAYGAAMFHVVTHAFFKALLFMGAGAVIISLHHEQDMRKMGGLKQRLWKTYWVMVVGVAAIAGFPLLSGFFSKDEILLSAFLAHDVAGHTFLYGVGLLTAVLTAFYMCRLLFMTFHGPTNVPLDVRSHVAEPGQWVMGPLYVLAILSVFGGLFGLPQLWGDMLGVENSDSLRHFLEPVLPAASHHEIAHSTEWWLVCAAVLAAAAGFALAFQVYLRRPELPGELARRFAGLYRLLVNKYYVDELYDAAIVRPLIAVSDRVLFRRVDAGLIDAGLVEGSARAVRGLAANGLKYVQSGLAPAYLLLMVAGVVAILSYLIR
jgi:NADH-quinone oxidoreductase subunit L